MVHLTITVNIIVPLAVNLLLRTYASQLSSRFCLYARVLLSFFLDTLNVRVSMLIKLSHERVALLYARPANEQLCGISLVIR